MRYQDLLEYKAYKVDTIARGMKVVTTLIVNPNSTDLRSFVERHKELRGVIDEKEYLYVWPAKDTGHGAMYDVIKEIVDPEFDPARGLYISTNDQIQSSTWETHMKPYNGLWVGIPHSDMKPEAVDSKWFHRAFK